MKRKGEAPATKDDLDRLETKLNLERFAMKEDLERFATKVDLERFATKEDLERFATKEDLERFATKEDLKQFAKMDDFDRLERGVKNMAVQVVGFSAALSGLRDEFSSVLVRMESRLVDRMDAFMAKSVKVERDQFWLIHRMDKIEDRVSRIEKRSP